MKMHFYHNHSYTKIAELHKEGDLYELWENDIFGDMAMMVLTCNRVRVAETEDDIYTAVKEYEESLIFGAEHLTM